MKIRLIKTFETNMKRIIMNISKIFNINLGFKMDGLELFMRAYNLLADNSRYRSTCLRDRSLISNHVISR